MTVLRSVVAVHGITVSGNVQNTGYGKELAGAVAKFLKGPGKPCPSQVRHINLERARGAHAQLGIRKPRGEAQRDELGARES
jgi:hypothetical protein